MRTLLQHIKGDRVIWVMLVFLTIYSGLAVASSVVSLSLGDGNVAIHIIRHVAFLLVGWGIIIIVHLVPYRWYSILATFLLAVAVILLVVTLIKGRGEFSAARWLMIPGTGLTFQTSDFAKIALIIFVARYLSRNQMEIEDFRKGFLPVLLAITVVCGLILWENLSTAALLFVTCMILLFIGRVKVRYLLGLAGAGLLLLAVLFLVGKYANVESRSDTWVNRIVRHIDKDEDPARQFQSDKAKIAIANGGFFGKFAGHSTQRRSLPQAFSDFIFAIIIEEYGFVFGALPIILFYMILLRRAGVIVRKCDRTFPAFLTIGLMTGLVIQAMINMGVSAGVFPVTGQPLPWISRGGTSILFTALSIGIILGVSRSLEEEVKVEAE
ncbi:MAG: FtsW/RodA/SpoVE family cell cycle protein [Bacteroidales bacterium]